MEHLPDMKALTMAVERQMVKVLEWHMMQKNQGCWYLFETYIYFINNFYSSLSVPNP